MKQIMKFSFLLFSYAVYAQGYLAESGDPRIKIKPLVPIQAFSFNLKDIRLRERSPFKNAMEKDAAYLLRIEPDRLLHRFYTNAGLTPNGDVYGGWESEGLS